MQLTLNSGQVASFSDDGTGIMFTAEGTTTAITSITPADSSALTTQGTSVYVAGAAGDTNCLQLTGNYAAGGDASACTNQLWYFILCKHSFQQGHSGGRFNKYLSNCNPEILIFFYSFGTF